MAKPTGAVSSGSYFYDVTGTFETPIYAYILLRVPYMPAIVQTYNEDNYQYKIGLSFQRKITDSSENVLATGFAGNSLPIGKNVSLTESSTPAWNVSTTPLFSHGQIPGQTPDYPSENGFAFNVYDVGTISDRYKVVLIELEFQSASSVDGTDVMNIYGCFVDVFDDDQRAQGNFKYFGGNGDGYAYYDRTTTSNNIDADEFVSSWEVMWALADTYERFICVNKPSFCVPLFGAASYVP